MKKIFKTFALMLLTAFAFSSCVDVPAPFNLPDKGSSSGGGGGSETVEGTPVTCAQAVELTQALADNASSSELYTITGYITEVVGNVSNNQQTFWMADAKGGGRIFEAYYANLPEGVASFTVGTKVKITGKLLKYVNANNGNVICEVKNPTVVILEDDGGGGGGTTEEGTPVTCAQAVELTNALADNGTSTETYTVTGYITEVVGSPSASKQTGEMQQTFWMADEKGGGRVFEAYWANLPEGVSAFTVGTKVKITGQLLKYVNANNGSVVCEIKNPTVVILEDDGGGGGETPPVEGTEVTCAQAVELTTALADNGTSTDVYSVTGYITETDGKVSRNQQIIWMADTQDGGKVFEGYWANLPSGVSVLTVGMKIKMTGKLLKYVNSSTGEVTPEIKNGDVVILEQGDGGGGQGGDGGDGGDTPGPGDDPVTDLVNGDFEEWVSADEPLGWKSASSASNATLSQSEEARNGSYACCIAAPGTANKRLATQEITLEAGTYTFLYYAKSTTGDVCQTRPGHVPVNADGSVGTYYYPKDGTNNIFFDLNNNEWTLVTYTFTLTETTKLCLIIMNPKTTAGKTISQDILIDDATLTKQ